MCSSSLSTTVLEFKPMVPRLLCKKIFISPISVVKFYSLGALKISPLVPRLEQCTSGYLPQRGVGVVTSSGTNVVVGVQLAPNSVKSLHLYPFERRTLAEKLIVKELGPDKPEVQITQQAREKEKTYKRTFSQRLVRLKSLAT